MSNKHLSIDCMVYIKIGKPDLFITSTFNPKWSEIVNEIITGQKNVQIDMIQRALAKVFRIKVKQLLICYFIRAEPSNTHKNFLPKILANLNKN
jgi:ATPase involved in DNA replication initiation